MTLHALFLIGILTTVPAGGADNHEIPLPVLEQADCAIDQRAEWERWRIRLRNVHNVPLVAFTLRFIETERPSAKRSSYSDRVMNPRRSIQPGESVDHATMAPCSLTVMVVASVFEDGTFAGSSDEVEKVFGRRQTWLRVLREMLSVLQTTPEGEGGVNGVTELQALLESLAGSREGRVGLDAVSALENRPDIFDTNRKEHLSKDTLIQALERAVAILARSVVARRPPA